MLRTRRRRSPFALLSSVILLGLLVGPVTAAAISLSSDEPVATATLTSGQVRLTRVVGGLVNPVGVVNAGDGTSRLFVLEKRGTVRVVSGGTLMSGFFLDLRGIGGGLPGTSTDYFDDDDGNIHEAAINRVRKAGITVGCDPDNRRRYCPSGVVTRAQMATFLDRAVGFDPTSRDFFTDDNTNKHEGAINRMAAADVTRGCTATTFCPNDSTTREQMAAFLRRAFDR